MGLRATVTPDCEDESQRPGRDKDERRRQPDWSKSMTSMVRSSHARFSPSPTEIRCSRPRLAGFVLDAFAGHIAVARGYAYKEVAAELFISTKTVDSHVSSVLRKLQLSSRHELTRWATERGLL